MMALVDLDHLPIMIRQESQRIVPEDSRIGMLSAEISKEYNYLPVYRFTIIAYGRTDRTRRTRTTIDLKEDEILKALHPAEIGELIIDKVIKRLRVLELNLRLLGEP